MHHNSMTVQNSQAVHRRRLVPKMLRPCRVSTEPFMRVNPLELIPGSPEAGVPGSREGGFQSPAVRAERRSRIRTTLHWPIAFFRKGSAEATKSVTQNLSSSGFYFYSELAITPGELLSCALTIPSHLPSGWESDRVLDCRARVTRVEPGPAGATFGIACEIEEYHLAVPEIYGETQPHAITD
jgi:hypothetical protein